MFLPKNYDFRVPISLPRFLLPITLNKWSIRVKFHFVQFTHSVNPQVFLPKNYDFRVLTRLPSFLLPVTSNKGSIRVRFHFVRFTHKKNQFLILSRGFLLVLPNNLMLPDELMLLNTSHAIF